MTNYLILLPLIFTVTVVQAGTKLLDDGMPDDGTLYFKNETIESCFSKTGSAVIQSCFIYLEGDKKEAYTTAFNQFMKKVDQKKTFFFDYKSFVKLIKQAKLDWDKFIKNECLAEATTFEKGGFVYSDVYNRCLILGYESRIKYYEAYQF